MKITVVTMIGYWSDGLAMHVANLAWALKHIEYEHVIVTNSEICARYAKSLLSVNFVDFGSYLPGTFIKFWDHFENIWNNIEMKGEIILFMEQDVLLTKQLPNLVYEKELLYSLLPDHSDYHHLSIGGKIRHLRVWEGGYLIPRIVIQNAIDDDVSFGSKRNWSDIHLPYYESKHGAPILLTGSEAPDTMDDLTLYCGLHVGTKVRCLSSQAMHLRGPEAIDRQYPWLSETIDTNGIELIRGINYDAWEVAAGFYISGTHDEFCYVVGDPQSYFLDSLEQLFVYGQEWMTKEQYNRLSILLDEFSG